METQELDKLISAPSHDILALCNKPFEDTIHFFPDKYKHIIQTEHDQKKKELIEEFQNKFNVTTIEKYAYIQTKEEEIRIIRAEMDAKTREINTIRNDMEKDKTKALDFLSVTVEPTMRQCIDKMLIEYGPLSTYMEQYNKTNNKSILWVGAMQHDIQCCCAIVSFLRVTNNSMAKQIFSIVSEHGNAESHFKMGLVSGKYSETGIEWYKKSASRGHIMSHWKLFEYYDHIENFTEAFKHLSYIMNHHEPDDHDLYEFGKYHELGLGDCKKDEELAIQYYTKSAQLGYPDSKQKIISMLNITKKDFSEEEDNN